MSSTTILHLSLDNSKALCGATNAPLMSLTGLDLVSTELPPPPEGAVYCSECMALFCEPESQV